MAKKMTEQEMRDAARTAVQYGYTPGEGTKKEPLRRRIAMGIKGKHYKTEAAKRILKKKKELDARKKKKTISGTGYSRDADAVYRRIKAQ
jgi:hypothetical protein